MAINIGNHMPAIGLEALWSIIAKPAFDATVDRNIIIIVKADQLTEAQRAGQRADFMRDALHQTAIAHEDIGMMIDNRVPRTVELCR